MLKNHFISLTQIKQHLKLLGYVYHTTVISDYLEEPHTAM